MARAYVTQNQVIKAFPYFQKGLEKDVEDLVEGEYFWIAIAFNTIGDYDKAEAYSQMAAKFACFGVGLVPSIYMNQGKFQEALKFADSLVVDCPQVCSRSLFRASLLLSEFEQAEYYFDQWRNAGKDFKVFELNMNYEIGYVYYQLGRTEEAEKIFATQIKRLESELDDDNSFPGYIALARIHAFIGEKKEALGYLTKYAKKGFTGGWHDFLLIDPFFEGLQDDPEFKSIIKQAQEEKAAIRAQVREMEERGELNCHYRSAQPICGKLEHIQLHGRGLVHEVLTEAIERYGAPEIFNTDQGSQFSSLLFTDVLKANNVRISMDGKGRAIDNIFIERLWRSVKYEYAYLNPSNGGLELYQGMKKYMDFYNNQRPHQSLKYQVPRTVFEQQKQAA